MNATDEIETVRRIVNRHRGQRGALFSMLVDVQKSYGFLPHRVLRRVSQATERPMLEIMALAETHAGFVLSPEQEDLTQAMPQTLAGVRCHFCNRSLLDTDQFIADRPSIRLDAASTTDYGWFRFAARPAVYGVLAENPLPETGEVSFYCPHCSVELFAAANCQSCGSPLVPMLDARGVITSACSNRACRCEVIPAPDRASRSDSDGNQPEVYAALNSRRGGLTNV